MFKHCASALNFLARPLRPERGATAVEYGLLLALIAAVIIAVVAVVGGQVSNAFDAYRCNLAIAQGAGRGTLCFSGGGGGGGGR
jgi:pilus assembly protein Flp/PilA